MQSLRSRAARRAPATAVLLAWALLGAAVLLPEGPGADAAVRAGLAGVTTTATVVTLLTAATGGHLARVWLLLGLGLAGYAGGFVVQFWVTAGEGGGPLGLNLSDCSSLLLYPFADAGLLLLARRRAGRGAGGSALEAGMVFSGVCALALPVVDAAYPDLGSAGWRSVLYVLAYPAGGFTLLVVTLTGLSYARRLDRVWVLLLAGFGLMTVGDAVYGAQAAAGRFRYGTLLDLLYTGGPVLVALAATAAPRLAHGTARGWRAPAALPTLMTVAALGVLLSAAHGRAPHVAAWSAAVCVLLAVCRTLQLLRQGIALQRSREQARTDELTGLPDRRGLVEALQASAAADPPSPERPLEVLLLDLDGFEEVNDGLGRAAADELLALVAEQLRAAAPGCVLARLDRDGFAVLLPRTPQRRADDGGPAVAARLRAAGSRPVLVLSTRVVLGMHVGHVACTALPDGHERALADELLRRADVALARAKADQSACVTWGPALDEELRDRLALLGELRLALADEGQVVAWYQPKTDPHTGRVSGYEALARWQHPQRGLLLPGAFLPAVERAGLLPELTRLVLEQSVAFLAELLAAGRQVSVAVNLSAPDLLDPELPARVGALLARHGVPARALRLEVTETVVMTDPERVLATLEALRALGVGLSLDDYGTGLASLGYLRVLPVDELKIDRSFVRDLLSDTACAVIVSSTVGLAHDLQLRVVAEGVEDQATLEALALAGCDAVQGWHTGRPAPAAVAKQALLADERPAAPAPRPALPLRAAALGVAAG